MFLGEKRNVKIKTIIAIRIPLNPKVFWLQKSMTMEAGKISQSSFWLLNESK